MKKDEIQKQTEFVNDAFTDDKKLKENEMLSVNGANGFSAYDQNGNSTSDESVTVL